MRRRQFIAVVGGVALLPLAARAQHGQRRIGVLMSASESDEEAQGRVAAFRGALQKLGWSEGRSVAIDYRWMTTDRALIERGAKELVALQPEVIVAQNTPTTRALLRETRTIPIVFATASDPVGSGFVTSLPRPGGNVTGFINIEAPLAGKWLELLKEVAPRVMRVAFLFNPSTAPSAGAYFAGLLQATAASLGVEAIAAPVRSTAEIAAAIAEQARTPNGGLAVMPDAFLRAHRTEIVDLAARHRVPAVYPFRFYAELGGLLSYGNDPADNYRRVADYVDRILKGAKAGELPVQVPVKFEMVVNLKTAKALGLDVPLLLQQRADEVIE